jgi:hypothetical protein
MQRREPTQTRKGFEISHVGPLVPGSGAQSIPYHPMCLSIANHIELPLISSPNVRQPQIAFCYRCEHNGQRPCRRTAPRSAPSHCRYGGSVTVTAARLSALPPCPALGGGQDSTMAQSLTLAPPLRWDKVEQGGEGAQLRNGIGGDMGPDRTRAGRHRSERKYRLTRQLLLLG